MMRKKVNGRKPGSGAAADVMENGAELKETPAAVGPEIHDVVATPAKPKRKAAEEPSTGGNFGVAEIRKAAAFANSIGGLDKAIALFQILKVAKEVQ